MRSRLAALGLVVLAACESAPERANAGDEAMPAVGALATSPAPWVGRTVTVGGRFAGWQGACKGSPPVARSDWMIEADGACLFVNGRLPPELSAAPPARGIGRDLAVTGVVARDRNGRAYLERAAVTLR